MPKYDYRCSACGKLYEKREGFDAPAVQDCPECGGMARRVLTPPAIVFKGSGWYITDSRKPEPVSSDGSSPAKSETKTESASSVSEAAAAD